MKDHHQETLLKTAKAAIMAAIEGRALPHIHSDDPELNAPCGCFVTIKNGEHLRGCLGQFESKAPLINLICEMAASSATNDPRFMDNPISPDEFDDLHIEISVLSPLKRTTDPLSLRLGTDGIYIRKGRASGCLLPQVATETGWTKEEFLSYCCQYKAGLHPKAWQQPDTHVMLFSADVFGEQLKNL